MFLNNITSQKELIDIAKLLYKTQKAISMMPYLYKESEAIIHANSRLGLGITGIVQSLDKLSWLDTCYKELRAFDRVWSAANNYPESIKLTTIKPSGSLSLLAGATPGVHPAFSRYYIRRVRIASNSDLLPFCRECNYPIEYARHFDGTLDYTTMVVEFPCTSGDNAVVAKDMTAIKQLDLVKTLQEVWADNAISVTVYYSKEELPAIQQWLRENYEHGIKSVSFLLRSDHGFDQAPYEEIDQATYERLLSNLQDSNLSLDDSGILDGLECEGSCPVK